MRLAAPLVVAAPVLVAGLACFGPPRKPCPACDTPDPATLTGVWYDAEVAEAWNSGQSDRLGALQMGDSCPHVSFPEPGRLMDIRAWDASRCTFTSRAEGDHWALEMDCDMNPGIANHWAWTGSDTATLRFAGQRRELVRLEVDPAEILAVWSALQTVDTDAEEEKRQRREAKEKAEAEADAPPPPPPPRQPRPEPEDDYVGPSKVHRRPK